MGCILDYYGFGTVNIYSACTATDAVQQDTDSNVVVTMAGVCTCSGHGSPDWSGTVYVGQPVSADYAQCSSVGIPAYDCSRHLDTQSARNRIGRYCGYDDFAILDRIVELKNIYTKHYDDRRLLCHRSVSVNICSSTYIVMKTLFSIVAERDKMETEVFSVSILHKRKERFQS